jgi:5'-3' exonuclease
MPIPTPPARPTLLPAPGEPDACYLIDLSAWARGIHEVRRPLAGDHVVSRSVVGRLVNLLLDQRPAFLAVAADTPGATWQNAIWPGYKAKRVDPGAAYDAEIETILRVLVAHRIPVLRAAGFEADDLLATAARRARRAGLRVVIVSRDHDLWQLCDEAGEIVAWDGTAETAIGAAEVRARYGVGPELLADLMALAGDSDEAPGIAGVGEKTAAELLRKRGSLAEVLRKWDWETGARRARLRDGGDAARMSRELVTLREDAPIAIDLAELAVGWDAADAAVIRALGVELEIPRMIGVLPGGFPKKPPGAERLAAMAAAPGSAEPSMPVASMPVAIVIAIAAPEPAAPAPVVAPIDESSPRQGDLFARLAPPRGDGG